MNKKFSVVSLVFMLSISFATGSEVKASPIWQDFCAWVLKASPKAQDEAELRTDTDYVVANGISITGPDLYPTELVMKNLNLDEKTLNEFSGKVLLSIGEGFSGLVPTLRQRGFNIRGLDIWYGNKFIPNNDHGKVMKAYLRDHGDYLIQGDARKLTWRRGSVDLVLSHLMINNFKTIEEHQEVLLEAYRILKPNGQARIFGMSYEEIAFFNPMFKDLYGEAATLEWERKVFNYQFRGQPHTREDYLLTITKHER